MKDLPRFRAGLLGATGVVGQRIALALDGHPWFRLSRVGASDRSAGRGYSEAVRWALSEPIPEEVSSLEITTCEASAFADCDVVFSALDTEPARRAEAALRDAGKVVVSNSAAFRMDPDVPLVIPEVNGSHLAMLDRAGNGRGAIVTNPNCSAIGLALALAPLHRAFGVRRVVVSTLQALSGAGLDGPRAWEMVDNAVPYIRNEEEKLATECGKILGCIGPEGTVEHADLVVSAHCHRVGTIDGHLAAVSAELEADVSPEQATETWASFVGESAVHDLPSAPPRAVVVHPGVDRPQPRLDRDAGDGMTVVIGRVRRCPVMTVRFELLVHNAVRGAAGAALLNAELLAATGRLAHPTS